MRATSNNENVNCDDCSIDVEKSGLINIQMVSKHNERIPSGTATPATNVSFGSDTPATLDFDENSLSLTPLHSLKSPSSTPNIQQKPESNATIMSSVLNLLLSIIGASTLTIPYAISQCGFLVSAILFISVAILNIVTLNFNMECAKEFIPYSSFKRLCMQTIPKFKLFVDAIVIASTFGLLCAYLVVIGDLLPDVMSTFYHGDSTWLFDRRIWITIYLLVFIFPTASLKQMNNLRFTSFFAVLCFGYIMVIVVLYAINPKDTLDACRDDNPNCYGSVHLFPSNYFKIFKVLPFFVQIYVCHFNTFSICNELKNCNIKRLNIVATSAIFISMLIYVVIGYGAYLTYGDTIDSNIILKYPKTNSLLILRVSLSIAIAFGYPVIMQSPRNSVSSLLFNIDDIKKLSNVKFYLLTYVIIGFSFMIAMVTDNITDIFGVVGSSATMFLVFILPGLFYYNFTFEKDEENKCKKYCSVLFIAMGIILIPFCITMQFIELD